MDMHLSRIPTSILLHPLNMAIHSIGRAILCPNTANGVGGVNLLIFIYSLHYVKMDKSFVSDLQILKKNGK